ncbi:hypothetical protein IMF27_25060 [Pseudomonas sp. PCH199]|uniref:hypothetical protein n=1 Tax=unclassified Pseudomonas TaxID=196821 RepID=UPI000BCBE03D|nr:MULTISPECIES: hypothetical protein [unclassified Pseudomonas]MCW8278427.1 hypothetical protein [Pseudomonas sp. PCH199]PAM81358.1 hypothetical protein CES87_25585 [Pseudomonas sp. ERMR1:02]
MADLSHSPTWKSVNYKDHGVKMLDKSDQIDSNQPWYARHEKLVQWITLLSVVIGTSMHYILVDRPAVNIQEESRQLTLQLIEESKRNQRLLEKKLLETQANTSALSANLDQIKSQIKLSNATIEKIQDPTRKMTESLQLERQSLERVILMDELVDTLAPNLQVKMLPDVSWQDRYIWANFSLTNSGKRAIRVAQPTLSVSLIPVQNFGPSKPLQKSSNLKSEICSVGFISPGETITCAIFVRSSTSLSSSSGISYRAEFIAKTDLPEESETSKRVRTAYNEDYLKLRMTKSITFDGDIHRE